MEFNFQEQIIANQVKNIYDREGTLIGTCDELYEFLNAQFKIDFESLVKKQLWKIARERCKREMKNIQSLPEDELKEIQIKYYKSELVSKFILDKLPLKLILTDEQGNTIKPLTVVI